MASHKLRVALGRVLGIRTTRVDGLRFSTSPRDVPWNVGKGLYNRTYEAPERSLVRAMLRPNDRVIEIGACTGVVSVLCASIVGTENLLSYEANPAMEPLIRQNFRLNRLKPNLRMKAVTVDGRNVVLHVARRTYLSSTLDYVEGTSITVPSDALAAVIAEFKPTTIVIDAEGAEVELFGNTDLAGIHKIVAEVHPHFIGDAPIARVEGRLSSLGLVVVERAHHSVAWIRSHAQ